MPAADNSIIELWKEHKVTNVELKFTCGGDNMGDTEWEVFPAEVPDDVKKQLTDYFEDAVYKNVEFYINSDGHYEGEAGTVSITLEEGDDNFSYSKDAESEYHESLVSKVDIALTPTEEAFVNANVLNINGEDRHVVVNYKRDFILTDDEEDIQKALEEKITDFIDDFVPEGIEEGGELDESATFTTNEDGEVLTIEGNHLKITVQNRYTIYKKDNE